MSYGVLGTLAVVFLVRGGSSEPDEPLRPPEDIRTAPARAPVVAPDAEVMEAPVQDARGAADFERLVAEGDAAIGRRIRVDLYCESLRQVALRPVERIESGVAALADGSGRVPGAECKWGQRSETNREDFLLLVPPELAESFASAPMVQDGFVSRKQVRAEVEWLGRSDALHLRTAGILLRMAP